MSHKTRYGLRYRHPKSIPHDRYIFFNDPSIEESAQTLMSQYHHFVPTYYSHFTDEYHCGVPKVEARYSWVCGCGYTLPIECTHWSQFWVTWIEYNWCDDVHTPLPQIFEYRVQRFIETIIKESADGKDSQD